MTVEALAARVVDDLRQRNLRIAVAESLTGGLLTGAITSVPGSSDVLLGGVVAYTNQVKAQILGVDAEFLATRGAVDGQVATAMARGVMDLLGADVAVATTGVAGPGPSDGHEPGTFWTGVATAEGAEAVLNHELGTRDRVRGAAVRCGLNHVLAVTQRGNAH